MKKVFVLLMLTCSIGFIKANPIPCTPVISEFYLVDSSHWYLELVFLQNSCPMGLTTLDGCNITTSIGTFYFKNGINITTDSIIVITQDSLQSPLQIDRNGDFISLKDFTGNPMDELRFGNILYSQISAPAYGQSIVNYGYWCIPAGGQATDAKMEYHIVKDNNPTIGFNSFTPFNATASTTTGTFTGIVYDNVHNPVSGIIIGKGGWWYMAPNYVCEKFFGSALSDSAGKFSIPEYSGKYSVGISFQPSFSLILLDSLLDIEPDSINYFEFTIDTLLTNVNPNSFQKDINLSSSPNPTTGETTISFGMPAGRQYTKALIKIYNSSSEMVRILPVSIGSSQNNYSVKWDGLCSDNVAASGIYYCNLELDGRKVATNKIIIAK
ncbi:MAG: hypothetical protein HY841_06285 [Bacteroidetes bacterium]|nr:hypothetical protein [Bacteroidota bacterium]